MLSINLINEMQCCNTCTIKNYLIKLVSNIFKYLLTRYKIIDNLALLLTPSKKKYLINV